jgi:hypothetical protein
LNEEGTNDPEGFMETSKKIMDLKDIITVSVALIGLAVSLFTFYLTQIRRSKLDAVIGPIIKFFHPPDGATRFFLPVTITNSGAQSGVVFKCAIVIARADNPEQNYYLEWHQFHLFDKSKNHWDYDDMAAPFSVSPKSAERRYVLFSWDTHHKQPLLLREGMYLLRFFLWTSERLEASLRIERNFVVDAAAVDRLSTSRSSKDPLHVGFVLNKETDSERLMTLSEVRKLLETR